MNRVARAALVVLIAAAVPVVALSGTVYTFVDLYNPDLNSLNSNGSAEYHNIFGNLTPARMIGWHGILAPTGNYIAFANWERTSGWWAGFLGAGGQWTYCYRAYDYATVSSTEYQGSGSWAVCIPRRIDPPCLDGCGDKELCPLVVNPENEPWRFSGSDDTVAFDMDGDGQADRTTWTNEGSSLSFVALDRNGNGTIDDGRELFGEATLLANGAPSPNGFEALREVDANRDGVVDAADPIWSSLLLWTDRNHDGSSDASELRPIAESTIAALSIDYHWIGRKDAQGNQLRYMAHVAGADAGRSPYYDVFFLVRTAR